MNRPVYITRNEAKRFILWYQGLLGPRRGDVMNWVTRLGAVQFDPLNPFLRNHELVLAARVEDFSPRALHHELYDTRRLMDGWDKCMCVYPTARYPDFAQERSRITGSIPPQRRALLEKAREVLEASGPMTAAELTRAMELTGEGGHGPGDSWNSGSQGKVLLETLYTIGEAIIDGKKGNAKRYAPALGRLPREVLEAPDPFEGDEQAYLRQRIFDRLRGFGLIWDRTGDAWLGIRGASKAARARAFEQLMEQGRVTRVMVEDVPAYVQSGDAPLIPMIPGGGGRIELLAPLDNLLWDRKWAAWIFDFEYTWEVYKPSAQRRYGYYVLPVLAEDHFAGRIEPWLNRETGVLEIRGLWWENPGERHRYETGLKRRVEELAAMAGASDVAWNEAKPL